MAHEGETFVVMYGTNSETIKFPCQTLCNKKKKKGER
jgi:hypothetical protein